MFSCVMVLALVMALAHVMVFSCVMVLGRVMVLECVMVSEAHCHLILVILSSGPCLSLYSADFINVLKECG